MSLPFFTIPIIHLQAIKPEINAAINPTNSANALTPEFSDNFPSNRSFKFAAIMGTSTIRNENFAIPSFLLFSNKPVEIVDPDLDIPGSTAIA